jgi:hypothetical protein
MGIEGVHRSRSMRDTMEQRSSALQQKQSLSEGLRAMS